MPGIIITPPGVAGGGAPASAAVESDSLTVGQSTMPRGSVGSAGASTGSQSLRLSYFTARKSETSTQVQFSSGTTAAGATPTLIRAGLYLIAANGDGVLVASTANDTTLLSVTSTSYTRSWTTPYAMIAGQRYAFSLLVVTAATAPIVAGQVAADAGAQFLSAPRITGIIGAMSDLPASFLAAAPGMSGSRQYASILP